MTSWGDHPLWTDADTERLTGRSVASIYRERRKRRAQAVVHWLWHTFLYYLAVCLAFAFIGAVILGALLTG